MTKEQIIAKVAKIEKELEKVRWCNTIDDWRQTQRFARKSRKRDELAKEKFKLQMMLEE